MAGRNNWETPPELFGLYDREYGFTLDVCASAENAKCTRYFDAKADALAQSWAGHTCWMNPPFTVEGTKVIGDWLKKAVEEAKQPDTTVVALVPSDTSTKWFVYGSGYASLIELLTGRVRYVGAPGSPNFGNAVFVFEGGKWGGGRVRLRGWKDELKRRAAA